MYDRRRVLQLGGVALAGSVAGCSRSGDEGEPPTEDGEQTLVAMTDELKFEPREVTIGVGETIVWETTGSVAHSATAYEADLPENAAYFASGEFETESAAREAYPGGGSVAEGETYSHTFETVGEFPYFCIPHEAGMRGTVIVES
jgi:plastocyanin